MGGRQKNKETAFMSTFRGRTDILAKHGQDWQNRIGKKGFRIGNRRRGEGKGFGGMERGGDAGDS